MAHWRVLADNLFDEGATVTRWQVLSDHMFEKLTTHATLKYGPMRPQAAHSGISIHVRISIYGYPELQILRFVDQVMVCKPSTRSEINLDYPGCLKPLTPF